MKIKINNMIFMLLYILVELFSFFNFKFFTILGKYNLYFTFVIFLILLINNIKNIDKKLLLYLLVFSFFALVSILFNSGGFGSIINVIILIIGFLVFSTIKVNEKHEKIIVGILCFIYIFYIIKSPNVYYTTRVKAHTDFNSNTIAQVILYITIIFTMVINNKIKKFKYKVLMLIIFSLSCFGIINCQSRGALLALIIFIVMYLMKNTKIIKEKMGKYLVLLSIIGIIFPILYTNLYKNGVDFKIPYINKTLYTGRETIWLNVMNIFRENYSNVIFGIGSKLVVANQETLNLHNMFFALIVNFGIPTFILTFLIIYRIIKNYIAKDKYFALVPIIVLSYFETTILWNMILVYFFFILSLINNSEKIERKAKNEKNKIIN